MPQKTSAPGGSFADKHPPPPHIGRPRQTSSFWCRVADHTSLLVLAAGATAHRHTSHGGNAKQETRTSQYGPHTEAHKCMPLRWHGPTLYVCIASAAHLHCWGKRLCMAESPVLRASLLPCALNTQHGPPGHRREAKMRQCCRCAARRRGAVRGTNMLRSSGTAASAESGCGCAREETCGRQRDTRKTTSCAGTRQWAVADACRRSCRRKQTSFAGTRQWGLADGSGAGSRPEAGPAR